MAYYEQTRDTFLDEMVRTHHTIDTYRRGINLFIEFAPKPLAQLSGPDKAILVKFTQWLLDECNLSPASTKLYLSACRRWFEWMSVNDHLPNAFPLAKALWSLSDALAGSTFRTDRRPPEPPEGIEQVIAYYDHTKMPSKLAVKPDPDRVERWALETLRNRALMHCLAESGGRISEVLSLRAGDFPAQAFEDSKVWRVDVKGKGGHSYYLRFRESLDYVKVYLNKRGAADAESLFVAHSKRYEDRTLTRQAAWHVVDRARKALGLPRIHPHDFRHYRATQLVNAGVPLDIVQDYLGHKSVETTRAYYARTKEERVDAVVEVA
jgi:site-specific recombinase XerD